MAAEDQDIDYKTEERISSTYNQEVRRKLFQQRSLRKEADSLPRIVSATTSKFDNSIHSFGSNKSSDSSKRNGSKQHSISKTSRMEEEMEEISDYYYIEPKQRKSGYSTEELQQLRFVASIVFPLMCYFIYEYFLGSQLAATLWRLASSRTMVLLEAIQYLPLIVNLRQYNMIGDVDDVSYYIHLYFHGLSFLFSENTQTKVIQLLLCSQLLYTIHLMWKHILYTGTQALQILRNSTMFVLTIMFIDSSLSRLVMSPILSNTFRGLVIIGLQAFRYTPQISYNSGQKHCAVQSVESHVLSMLPALAKVYIGIFDFNFVDIVGYSFCFVSNLYLAYQVVLAQDDSKAYIEREKYLKSKLPKTKLKRRSFSLKYKPGFKGLPSDLNLRDDESDESRTVFSDLPITQFDHGPMI